MSSSYTKEYSEDMYLLTPVINNHTINEINDNDEIDIINMNNSINNSINNSVNNGVGIDTISTSDDDSLLCLTPTKSNSTINSVFSNITNNSHSFTCFICYEYEKDGCLPIALNTIEPIVKNCECQGNIHVKCLFDWLKHHPSCPVCRTPYNVRIVKKTARSVKLFIFVFGTIFAGIFILVVTNNVNIKL